MGKSVGFTVEISTTSEKRIKDTFFIEIAS